ncbi:MAG: hypothetical protein ALAOOOJD_01032 [bacterium]|nr:hypothetical protein [bacterium]
MQDSAKLLIKNVVLAGAPNLPFVNLSQSFAAAVTIENTGQEAADTVQVHLATAGGSTITPGVQSIATIPGGTNRVVSFDITASNTENPAGEIFQASVIAGKARNTSASLIPGTVADDTARAFIQQPAALQITRVLTSESQVEAGRTSPPWYIYAVVTNNGSAAIALTKPSRDDVTVQLGGVIQNDYSIQADTLLRRNRTLRLAAGEIDTVRYAVLFTGAQRGGQAALIVKLNGRDLNNNAALTDDEVGQIQVNTTASVQIVRTLPIAPRVVGELGYVNVGQQFGVEVTLQNISRFESVKDVLVRLTSNTGRSLVLTVEQPIDSIKALEFRSLTFFVQGDTSNPAGVQPETFASSIISATTPGGQPAKVSTATDSTAQVLVQRPAQLAVSATISEPSGILSGNQFFDFTARVRNIGQAAVNDSGALSLTLPSGFSIAQAPTAFPLDAPILWRLQAPNVPMNRTDLIVAISQAWRDLNVNAPALSFKDADTVSVQVVPTDVKIDTVYVTAPPGAQDGIVSSGQKFQVRAKIIFSNDLTNTSSVLFERQQPNNYLVGVPVTVLDEVTWEVQAPNLPYEIPTYFVVRARGTNRSGQLIERLDSLSVVTVERAELNLNAQIIAPPGATGGKVSFGQTFTVSATLTKNGRAGVVDTAKVRLEPLGGFTVTGNPEKVIDANGQVQWQVTAPNTKVKDSLTVQLTRLPFDENSNASVALTSNLSRRRIPVETDSSGYAKILSWAITSPTGATSGIVSTRQLFVVQADIESRHAEVATAFLRLSGSLSTKQSLLQNVNVNGRTIVSWVVQAPSATTFGRKDTLKIEVTGRDTYSDQAIAKQTASQLVETVEQARLVLEAVIVEPQSARVDGVVGLNALVRVMARITNNGQAAIRGNARIKLSLPDDPAVPAAQDYRMANADDSVQTIDANSSFTWQFRARSVPSLGRETIRVRLLEPYPVDVNTDSTAAVSDNDVPIQIQTEPKRLFVQTLPAGQGPAVRGETSSLLMRLKLTNEGNINSSHVLLRAMTLHAIGRDNKPLQANQVMKALRVVDTYNRSRVFGNLTSIPASDSLRLPFAPADTLLGGNPDSVDVLVDIADNVGQAFRLIFKRPADIDAIDQDSGDPVEIIFQDASGNEVTADQIISAKRVIAEADFQKAFYNYPNPFDPDGDPTCFTYVLKQPSDVEFRIYTLLGELVYSQSFKAADREGMPVANGGANCITWNGRNGDGARILNGVYLAVLKAGGSTATTKVAVLRK